MKKEAWIVAIDMGYGHQRAAYSLRHLSPTGEVIIANNYEGIPRPDKQLWQSGQRIYEWFSRLSNLPLIGNTLFGFFNTFQEIPLLYPRRDLSAPNLQLRQNYYLIRRGWGKDLINFLSQKKIPLITTFFTVAFMAEEHGFKNDIYVVICDSDISRAWAPLHPSTSRIKYLAPCPQVVSRLKLYGVKGKNIFLTGFPLPEENSGTAQLTTLRHDMAERLSNLDPEKHYRQKHASTIKQFLSKTKLNPRHHHPLTLTFAIGGAGAQRTIADAILKSLKHKLLTNKIKLNLVAGSRPDVYAFFKKRISELGLTKRLNKNLTIIYARNKEEYFSLFNKILRTTDILWTKPSELVFYARLGLPILMAPSLGSQEIANRTWLETIGTGIGQNDPRYTDEWLFGWINSGQLAKAAMAGYLDGGQFAVRNIVDAVFYGKQKPAKNYQLL